MSGGGDDPFAEEEAHESHERYLITYADMITLLMALFIILFAIGQTDLEKYRQFAEGAHSEVSGGSILPGASTGASPSGDADPASDDTDPAEGDEPAETGDTTEQTTSASTGESEGPLVDEAERLAADISLHLEGGGHGDVEVETSAAGVVVTLPDEITFESGAWTLLPSGVETVREVAEVLAEVVFDIIVSGHTDDRPMPGPLSNWELSTNRASAVVRELLADGVDASRLSTEGHADTRPVADNATPAGRAENRRVEIVILVPGVASEATEGETGAETDTHGTHQTVGYHIGPPPVDVLAPTTTGHDTSSSSSSGGGH